MNNPTSSSKCCEKCDNDQQTRRLAIAIPYCLNNNCLCHQKETPTQNWENELWQHWNSDAPDDTPYLNIKNMISHLIHETRSQERKYVLTQATTQIPFIEKRAAQAERQRILAALPESGEIDVGWVRAQIIHPQEE